MLVSLAHRVRFCAATRLFNPELPEEENRRLFGPCGRTHGHDYVLEATVSGTPEPRTGMIFDLVELESVLREEVVDRCDHRDLSTDLPELRGRVATTENLAALFFERIDRRLPAGLLAEVKLYESDTSFAAVRRS